MFRSHDEQIIKSQDLRHTQSLKITKKSHFIESFIFVLKIWLSEKVKIQMRHFWRISDTVMSGREQKLHLEISACIKLRF